VYPRPARAETLLDFLVGLVGPAEGTELAHFEPFGGGFLVLGLAIVLPLTLGALEGDDFSWHGFSFQLSAVSFQRSAFSAPALRADR
jgi:hypothetical protein